MAIGGAERQASLLLPRLEPFGLLATAVAGPGPEIVDWFHSGGLQRFLWSRHFPGGERFRLRRLPAVLRQLQQLLTELDDLHRRTPFDLVVGSLGYGWAVGGLAAARWGVPAIWRAGGLSFGATADPRSPEAVGVRLLARILHPSLLLCNAHAVADYWRRIVALPTRVVPNGVPIPRAVPPQPEGDGRTLVVGFAGRLAPEKDLPSLLEAVAIARMRGVPVRLRIAGPGPQERLRARAEALKLEGAVEFLGRVSQMDGFYASCHALALPSRSEGCANVVLEAMSFGRPVIATAVGGTPEILSDGREGFLVPPADPWALASAIERLAASPELRARLGAQARQRSELFSPERCAAGFAAVALDVLGLEGERRLAASLAM